MGKTYGKFREKKEGEEYPPIKVVTKKTRLKLKKQTKRELEDAYEYTYLDPMAD